MELSQEQVVSRQIRAIRKEILHTKDMDKVMDYKNQLWKLEKQFKNIINNYNSKVGIA